MKNVDIVVPPHLSVALQSLCDLWSELACGGANPFANIGTRFECDVFGIQSYSWYETDVPSPNFRWASIEVSWYKYLGRSMTVNRIVTDRESAQLLDECSAALMLIANGRRPIVNADNILVWK